MKSRVVGLLFLLTLGTQARMLSDGESFLLRALHVDGNTVFRDEALLSYGTGLLGTVVSIEQLEVLRVALTRHYVEAGYVNSGALLDDQDISAGQVTFHVVEGQLNETVVTTDGRIRAKFLAATLGDLRPLRIQDLQQELLLLRSMPQIESVDAALHPGDMLGEATLDIAVVEAKPWQASLVLDNHRPPSVGSESLQLQLGHNNVFGRTDRVSLSLGLNDGELGDLSSDLRNLSASYSLPLNAGQTRLSISYDQRDYALLEEPLSLADLESRSRALGFRLAHPVIDEPRRTVQVLAGFEWRKSELTLGGSGFPINEASPDGMTRLSVLQLGLSVRKSQETKAVALQTELRAGTSALHANEQGEPDGEFFSVRAHAALSRRFSEQYLLLLRANAQWTDDVLPSQEQLALGGVSTVRGYRENRLVRDRGLVCSAEVRRALVRWREVAISAAGFVDAGWAENVNAGDTPNDISSLGIGLLANRDHCLQAELYWAHGLRRFDNFKTNAQDIGLHARIVYRFL